MDLRTLKAKCSGLIPALNERSRRVVAAAEAHALGPGGIVLVAKASGISCSTISRGLRELRGHADLLDASRIRRPGGGRTPLLKKDPRLLADLEALVEPGTRGDPESLLRWTSKSLRTLARQLQGLGHAVSAPVVGTLLRAAGYSLQANQKTREGTRHPDRNAQFESLNRRVLQQQRAGRPVLSVDTKKKEWVGECKNAGREWRPQGHPRRVRVHDFLLPGKGNAIPYGGYDLTRNAGWVSVGLDHDTAACAVHSVRRWWRTMGRSPYPRAKSLVITADAGGSHGARSRLWKWAWQKLADQTRVSMAVCHRPPGTSQWNTIAHRLLSFISQNWRGRPLVSVAVIVSLIAATRTSRGLKVRCELDPGRYPEGAKITDEQMAPLHIKRATFHGDWNDTIHPRSHREKQSVIY